jgi:peroxiredoxin
MVILVVALGALGLYLALRPRSTRPLEVGDSAAEFTLPLFRNAGTDAATGSDPRPAPAVIRLSDYRHRVVLVNFWATWCPPCVEEAPSLEKFAEQMRTQGITVVGISVDEDANALEKFLDVFRTSFPIARDPQRALATRYGTFKFPETYILDRDGRVAEKIIGAIDWQDSRIVEYVRALAGPSQRASR